MNQRNGLRLRSANFSLFRVSVAFAALAMASTAMAQGPTAAFTADETTGAGAMTVWFTDTSTPGSSEITAWEWDFGDGTVDDPLAEIQNPAHYYEFPGTYSVSLTVTTDEGTDSITQTGLITVAVADVFYVDIDTPAAEGEQDGLAWATAFNTIQEGVDAADGAGGGEVWVAEGVYTDDINAGDADGLGDGDDHCVVWLKDGVLLFGGFDGTESGRDTRDPENHAIIIDGENTRRGIIGVLTTPSCLDGLTARNGYVTGKPAMGGGLYATTSTTLGIHNCTFTQNRAMGTDGAVNTSGGDALGGGVYIDSNAFLGNCALSANTAQGGSGGFTFGSPAPAGNALGGGAYVSGNAVCENSGMDSNTAQGGSGFYTSPGGNALGGGAYVGGNAVFENSGMDINTAQGGDGANSANGSRGGNALGGGAYVSGNGVLKNSGMDSNTAQGGDGTAGRGGGNALGGGAYVSGNGVLENSGMDSNTAQGGAGGGTGGPTGAVGTGGNASGAGVYVIGNAVCKNIALDANTAQGGDGGDGGHGGDGMGGGAYLCGDNYDCSSFISVHGNHALRGLPDGSFRGHHIWFCNYPAGLDAEGDGLLCWGEADQGCDPDLDDAALWVSLDVPSPGASFRAGPIALHGRAGSPDVKPLGRSVDSGETFTDIGTPSSDLTWDNNWSPSAPGAYSVVIRGFNGFSHSTDSETITINYQPDAPEAYITAPIHRSHVNGQLTVTGKAAQGTAGFGSYTLEFTAGEDPDSAGPWTTIQFSPTEVIDATLGTWNVLALAEGWYTLRLRADDGAGTESKTWVAVYVDHDTTPPSAPASVAIEGLVQPDLVANDDGIAVTGQGDGDCYLASAELIDEEGAVIKEVTYELTLHFSGALRGTCYMPSSSGASQVALRVQYRDFVGNVGPTTISNYLAVENAPPAVVIDYLPDSAFLHYDSGSPETYTLSGTAEDDGDSGVREVEVQVNGGGWNPATGTDTWTWGWTPGSADTYIIEARATDYLDNVSATDSVTVTVSDTEPAAYIMTPAAGTSIFSGTLVDIVGTAKDPLDFQDYQVQYKDTGDPGWTAITLTPVTTSVHEGLLAQWDTTGLDSPSYELQVVVRDSSANVSSHMTVVGILADLSMSGIPDLSFYEGGQRYHYAYLPDYVMPSEGAAGYAYTLAAPLPPAGMGVTIDGEKWLNLVPDEHWFGWADVTVQADDGDGHIASDVFRVEITNLNDAPTAPGISLTPAKPGTADELICSVVTHASDPDSDPFLYVFDWYRSENGVQFGEVLRSVMMPADFVHGNLDSLTSILTTAGEWWRCVVRGFDGEAYGALASETVRIYQDSAIDLDAAPVAITLGQPVTLMGQITGLGGLALVGFTSISPDGVEDDLYPEGTVSSGSGEFTKTFHPRAASEGRAPWLTWASWDGDSGYRGAESGLAFYTVAKAQPSMTINLSHASALLQLEGAADFAVQVALYVPGFPTEPGLLALYDGLPVRLSVQTPDRQTPYAPLQKLTAAGGRATFTKADFDAAGVFFDVPGVWQFKAEFAGDDNFHLVATDDFDETQARLTIKEGAGYAILALGQLDDAAEGRAEHAQTADYVRDVLIERSFDAEDIYYLRDQGAGALAPTKENLQYAIEVWARDRMLASPAPLYVILADHGSPGIFHLDVAGTPEQESVTAQELAGYLDVLESSLGAKASAADQEIVVVYGACYSGGFVPALSGPGRVLITSCGADEISYRGVLDGQTGVRDGEFFLMEFFRTASEGRSLAQAFEAACLQTSEYTVSRSNGGAGDVPQHPLLDDNGDGSGTTGQLSSVESEDGGLVHGLVLGLGANAGNGITWFTASPPVYLDPGDTVGVLAAETAGRLPEGEDAAWVEIKTPDYDNGVVAAPGYENFQRVASMVGPIAAPAPALLPSGHYAYQWNDALLVSDPGFAGFNNPGTYKLYYFLRDSVTEQVGAYLVTNVYVSRPANMNPLPVALHYPFEDTDVYTSTFFVWGETVDPDGDALSYQLEVSDDLAFPEAGTTVVMTTETMAQLTGAQSLLDLHRYYWRVIAVDEYGAQSLGNEVRTFTTNNHNPAVPGAVTGMVRDGDTGEVLVGAAVTVLPSTEEAVSNQAGFYFVGGLQQGIYRVEAGAVGYTTAQRQDVIVESGEYTSVDLELAYDGGNRAPVLSLIGARTVAVGETLTIELSAEDADAGDMLLFLLSGMPEGAAFDAGSGLFTWTPEEGQEGDYELIFTVRDNGSPSMSDSEDITVTVRSTPGGEPRIEGPGWVAVGGTAVLRFVDTNLEGAVTYQWEKDEVVLADEVSDTLTLEACDFEDEGWYKATASTSAKHTKAETVTAQYYLTVVEALPLSALWLALLLAVPAVVLVTRRLRRASR